MGRGDPTLHNSIQKAQNAPNFYTSKRFLKTVMKDVKGVGEKEAPRLSGHVLILGIGDTALDCARSAFRRGAQRVTVAFRRGF
jgi:dihydropyrimidine dehydrogenase (NADP+)